MTSAWKTSSRIPVLVRRGDQPIRRPGKPPSVEVAMACAGAKATGSKIQVWCGGFRDLMNCEPKVKCSAEALLEGSKTVPNHTVVEDVPNSSSKVVMRG